VSRLYLDPERLASPGSLAASLLAGDEETAGLLPTGILPPSGVPARSLRAIAPGLTSESFHCLDPGARDRLDAVLAGHGLVVSTGQQPQLFGGPLYVLYKALTAVRTAAQLERRLGTPCLAVFWVAGDDHDWLEVASIGYLDSEERLSHLTIPPPPDRTGRSVGPSVLPPGIGAHVEAFLGSLETHEAGERWSGILSEHYRAGQSFTSAFVATNGGPLNSTLFYVVYLYRKAFEHLSMGYASAMAWILLLIVLACTLIIFRTSGRWVFYRSELE